MLCFYNIKVSEGIDANKTTASKGCDIWHYWHFLNFSFNCQPNVCNKCHYLLMLSINLTNPNNIKIDGNSYKNFLVYYIGCITIKDLEYVKINYVNFFTLLSTKWMDVLKNLMEINVQH